MRVIYTEIRITNPAAPSGYSAPGEPRFRVRVDKGAGPNVVTEALVTRLGLRSCRAAPYRLADGKRRVLEVFPIEVWWEDRSVVTEAVLAPGAEPVIGLHTLEALGLNVDPLTERVYTHVPPSP